MKRSCGSLDRAVDSVYVAYESVLKKRGIDSKEILKLRLLKHYSSGDLESHVKKISLDKFKTLVLRMIIDAPSPGKETSTATDSQKNSFRVEVIKYVRRYLEELQPLPNQYTAQPQKELERWESENSDNIREMFDNVVDNFGELAVTLGLDIDQVTIQAYHTIIEDEF